MSITIHTVSCGAYQANAYLVFADDREDCVLIDPGDDLQGLRAAIQRTGRKLAAILLTHGHFDHILAAEPLAKETGAEVYIHGGDMEMLNDPRLNAYTVQVSALPAPRSLFAEAFEEKHAFAGMDMEILSTPGHSKGSACIYLPDENVLFSGDTLFQAGFGRMDLYGGSPEQMRRSLMMLFDLPADVKVYPGHGPMTTIGAERGRYRL